MAYKDDERDLGEKYKKFAGDFGRDAGEEATLVAYAQNYDYAPKIKDTGIIDYNTLAELYRDYVSSQDVYTTRKAEVARDIANARAGLPRKDTKPHMGSEDRHKQNNLKRKIQYFTYLQQILAALPG